MAAPAPPGAPRPSNQQSSAPPPNYVPNSNRAPNPSLSQIFQNLQINQPQNAPILPSSGPSRPPSFGTAPRFPSSVAGQPTPSTGASPFSRPSAPPPGVVPRPVPPNIAPGRPSAPPPFVQAQPVASRPPSQGPFSSIGPSAPLGAHNSNFSGFQGGPPSSGARPSIYGSPPMASGSVNQPNGPPMFSAGTVPGGPRFPPPGGSQQPPLGPPPSIPLMGTPTQPPTMRSILGTGVAGSSADQPAPFSLAQQRQNAPLPSGSPFGLQPPQSHMRQVTPPPRPGSMQPPTMYGMPPPLPRQIMDTAPVGQTGSPMTGSSKIDPNQIPHPLPSSSAVVYETRTGNQANIPPSATGDYIVRDTGNCSPRYMRCTINQVPCTSDLLSTSGMHLALLVQPLALPHPSEEPIQVVDFGEGGPVRCSRCKAYMNPFVKFIDQGKRFICNFCGGTSETPREYHCNLGPDGRRKDAEERPELCRGTVEFVASKDYMVRDPMPAVFFFLIDVSMNSIQTGATAAACSAINQVIADLPLSSGISDHTE